MLEIKKKRRDQIKIEIWKREDAWWSWIPLMSNGNQKENAEICPGFLELSKIQGSHISWCICLLMVFFSGSKGGGRRWLERDVSLLGQYCHRAEAVWAGPSCELLFLARPSSGGGSDQLRNNRTWTQAWPLPFSVCSGRISGQSGSGLSMWSGRAQGPGALQLLPGTPVTGRREAGPQFHNCGGP